MFSAWFAEWTYRVYGWGECTCLGWGACCLETGSAAGRMGAAHTHAWAVAAHGVGALALGSLHQATWSLLVCRVHSVSNSQRTRTIWHFKKTLYPLCWLINFFFLEANLMLASVPWVQFKYAGAFIGSVWSAFPRGLLGTFVSCRKQFLVFNF